MSESDYLTIEGCGHAAIRRWSHSHMPTLQAQYGRTRSSATTTATGNICSRLHEHRGRTLGPGLEQDVGQSSTVPTGLLWPTSRSSTYMGPAYPEALELDAPVTRHERVEDVAPVACKLGQGRRKVPGEPVLAHALLDQADVA